MLVFKHLSVATGRATTTHTDGTSFGMEDGNLHYSGSNSCLLNLQSVVKSVCLKV